MWSIFWSWVGRKLCAWAAIWMAAGPWPPECRASRTCPAWQALAARGYPQALLEDLFWNNLRRMI